MNGFERVLAAIKAALVAAPAVAGGNVYRSRARAIKEGVDEAVIVRIGGADPTPGEIKGAPVDWSTTVTLEHYVRAADAETCDQDALALYSAVYARLMADITLGGVALDLVPGSFTRQDDEEDTSVSTLIAQFIVWHRTAGATVET